MGQQPIPPDWAAPTPSPQPARPYGGGAYRPWALPHNPLRVVELSLALVAVATAFMPWFALGGSGACPYSYLGPCGPVFNASTFDVPDLSGGSGSAQWLDVLFLGFLLAVLAAIVGVVRRAWRPAALVEIAGFGLIVIGAGMALTSGPTDWRDSYLAGFTVQPSFGLWSCLLVASFGAVFGLVHLVRPDIGWRAPRPLPMPAWGAPAQPTWGVPPQPAWGAPAQPTWGAPAQPMWGVPPQTTWGAPAQPTWGAPPPPPPITPAWGAPAPVPQPTLAASGSPVDPADTTAPADSTTPADATTTPAGSAGQMATLENGRTTAFEVPLGRRVIVGRGPGADLVIADPRLSPAHTAIERRGPGWLVSGLDGVNPTFLLDSTGRPQPVSTDLGLRSGTLLVGSCQVLLYPPRT